MNFEREKDPKEAIKIGMTEHLINCITKVFAKDEELGDYEYREVNSPNNPEIKGEWVQPRTGAYFKLIKTRENRLFTAESEYGYYLEYDDGVHYGNMLVDDIVEEANEL